jgi:hypothetical protein
MFENTGASSIFKPNKKVLKDWFFGKDNALPSFEIKRIDKIKTTTLDKMYSDRKIPKCDLIRINIQGGELKAINGGKSVFKNALGIQIELSFNETYQGAPFFSDIDPILRKMGFDFFDFLAPNAHAYSPYDESLDYNLVWRNPSYRIFESHCLYLKNHNRIKNCDNFKKLAILAELYGQKGYANFILNKYIKN